MSQLLQLFVIYLSSFVGTLGFSVILHAPKKSWLSAASLGGLSYAMYWLLMQLGVGDPLANFAAALTVSLLAQFCARRMQMIATIFVALSIIPLVPGLGLYRCMSLLGQGKNAAGLQAGVAAMIAIMMIALGLAMGAFIFRALVALAPHHRRKEDA